MFVCMARLTGTYRSDKEAQIAVDDLEKAGIPRGAIRTETTEDSKTALSVLADADHADEALRIMKIHGSAKETADPLGEEGRYPTENRDTSREPHEERDDVGSITKALDRDRPRVDTRH